MKKKTFLHHLIYLRKFCLYILLLYCIIYLIVLVYLYIYSNSIVDYLLQCTSLEKIYYNGIYDKILLPFNLSYYISLGIMCSLLIVMFIHYYWHKNLLTVISSIWILLNWYYMKCYFLPYGMNLLFQDVLQLHPHTNNKIFYFPQLTNIMNAMLDTIVAIIFTIYLPILSGLLFNKFSLHRANKKQFFIFFFIIISGIVAPGDPMSHIIMAGVMIVSFQFILMYGTIIRKWKKKD